MALKDLFECKYFELYGHKLFSNTRMVFSLDDQDIEYFRNKYRPQLIKQLQHELNEIQKKNSS